MANDTATDNYTSPRVIVAPPVAGSWIGATLTAPDSTKYVRGTVELRIGGALEPSVGVIESCEFTEIGQDEELSDGDSGVEVYDFYEIGWKVDVTARFRKKDDPPQKGEIFSLAMPEGGQETNLRLRFVCTESGKSWSERGIRKCKFSGKIHASMVRSALISSRITSGVAVENTVSSAAPTGEWSDPV